MSWSISLGALTRQQDSKTARQQGRKAARQHCEAFALAVANGACRLRDEYFDDVRKLCSGLDRSNFDAAAGYAAMTMVSTEASVLTAEDKINFMAPARGEKIIARGKVVKAGKTLIVTSAEVFAVREGGESLCAVMQQTMMVVYGATCR